MVYKKILINYEIVCLHKQSIIQIIKLLYHIINIMNWIIKLKENFDFESNKKLYSLTIIMAEKNIDLINRDPNSMNHFVQVDFEDVLAEPNGAHSSDW